MGQQLNAAQRARFGVPFTVQSRTYRRTTMGLDQYAFARHRRPDAPVDFEQSDNDNEVHYWRKHPNLHGWMEQLYREKGGKAKYFNCVAVELTPEDIDRLERDLHDLPGTTGFFFGTSQPEDTDDDREFIAKARAAFAEGRAVYYTSWW
jgi:hypothetical protein